MLRFPSFLHAPGAAPRWQVRLERRARRRRAVRHPWAIAAAGVLALAVAAVAWQRLRIDGGGLLAALEARPVAVAVAAFVLLWNRTRRAAWQARRDFARSWFATAPLAPRDVARAIRARVGARLSPLLAVALLPLAAAAASGRPAMLALAALGLGGGLEVELARRVAGG